MDRIDQESPDALKRRLGKRLGVAALLIVLLLGGLAVFDHLAKTEREAPLPSAEPPLGPTISSSRPNVPVAPLDEPVTPSPDLAPQPVAVDPVSPPVAVGVEPPPKPDVAARPAAATVAPVAAAVSPGVKSRPATSVSGTPAVSAPAGTSPTPPAPEFTSVPEESGSAPVIGATTPAIAAATPVARLPVPAAKSSDTPPRSALSRLTAGFVLQAGVFASAERAEELKARLILAGVPVTIETRVQVGPFATQKEADEARRKIKELGIDTLMIPPRASRR